MLSEVSILILPPMPLRHRVDHTELVGGEGTTPPCPSPTDTTPSLVIVRVKLTPRLIVGGGLTQLSMHGE